MRLLSTILVLGVGASFLACSGESLEPSSNVASAGAGGAAPGCLSDADCSGSPDAPLCELATGECAPLPAGHELGWRDGSPGSVTLTLIFEPANPREPTDLGFNPAKPTELWVISRKDDSVFILENPGDPEMTWKRKRDPAASHFMDRPPALAFGAVVEEWGQTWATCGDSDNGGNDFMGPALFSADPAVFAHATPDGLGSHLDMLHSTTFCRGIAHVEANVFWVFNSNKKSLDKYDFNEDHGPGADDHSDGRIYRYASGAVLGIDDTPSHLAYNSEDLQLYIADTGNKRIAKLDTASGTPGSTFSGFEDVVERRRMDDAVVVDVVPPGALEAPSGIEIRSGLLYVTDNATSRFHAFDMANGQLVRTLDTGLPPGSLAGLTFGPDGKVYFVDLISARVYRIDPK